MTAREHGGDPRGEYLTLRTGAGIIERTDLGVVRMWGRDPVRMLNGLITNDLALASETRSVYAAMLTPKGRMITDLHAWTREGSDGKGVRFAYPKGADEALSAHLAKYVPPLFAKWEKEPETTVIGVYGPAARLALADAIGAEVPPEDGGVSTVEFEGGALQIISNGWLGFDLLIPAALAERVIEALVGAGATPIGVAAFEAARIEAGRPRWGAELTEETLPAEAYESSGLLDRAVSFRKGCYTGQEVVVRIAHRGHVNRNLRGLTLTEEAPAGTVLYREDGKEVGRLTSVAGSPPLDRPIALGYVRREVPLGDRVRVGSESGSFAEVGELPFPTSKIS